MRASRWARRLVVGLALAVVAAWLTATFTSTLPGLGVFVVVLLAALALPGQRDLLRGRRDDDR